MLKIMSLAIHRRWLVLVGVTLISLLAFLQLPGLQLDISAEGMIVRGNASEAFFQRTLKTFGADKTTVLFFSDPDLFTPKKLTAIRALTDEVNALPFVSRTVSLFSVRHIHSVDGVIHTRPYLYRIPDNQTALNVIKRDALKNPLINANLLSSDATSMAINVYFNDKGWQPGAEHRVTSALEKILNQIEPELESAFQVGPAYLRVTSRAKIDSDQRIVLPIAVLVLLTTLGLMLRKLSAALIPLITAGLSVLWTLGFMSALGITVNIMTAIIPALLIIVGSTEDIHLLAEYHSCLRQGHPRPTAINCMARRMGTAILLTFITTYLGFLSITLNRIDLLRDFGLMASTGLFFNFTITVLLVPVFLSWFGCRESSARIHDKSINNESSFRGIISKATASQNSSKNRCINHLTCSTSSRRNLTYILLTAVGLIGLYGTSELRVDNNPLSYFQSDSEVVHRAETLHQRLSGLQVMSVVLTGSEGAFLKTIHLAELELLQAWLNESGQFDKTLSFANFLSVVHAGLNDEWPDLVYLPERDDIVSEYMALIPHQRVSTLVSSDYSQARIIVRHHIGSSAELTAVTEAFLAYADEALDPGISVALTGQSYMIMKAADQMASGQAKSLGLMALVIFLLVSFLFLNYKAGLIAVATNLFPVLLLFGIMGYINIPLNTATVMVAAIAIGISVDHTMHFMVRYHRKTGELRDDDLALAATTKEEAIPIGATAIALMFGFSAMALSSFPPVAQFGLLSALVMILALISTFVVLPTLLSQFV